MTSQLCRVPSTFFQTVYGTYIHLDRIRDFAFNKNGIIYLR